MKRVAQIILLLVLALATSVPASALTQEFSQSGLGEFNIMEFFITSAGTTFDSGGGVTGFNNGTPAGLEGSWTGTNINPAYVYASGSLVTYLEFYLNFTGTTSAFTFDVLTYNADTLLEAVYVSYNNGWSIGVYDLATFDPTTYDRSVATPLPASLWFLGSGLVGLIGFRKRRRR